LLHSTAYATEGMTSTAASKAHATMTYPMRLRHGRGAGSALGLVTAPLSCTAVTLAGFIALPQSMVEFHVTETTGFSAQFRIGPAQSPHIDSGAIDTTTLPASISVAWARWHCPWTGWHWRCNLNGLLPGSDKPSINSVFPRPLAGFPASVQTLQHKYLE
jgi:hypothetical protein